jgi:DNA adenine methylase
VNDGANAASQKKPDGALGRNVSVRRSAGPRPFVKWVGGKGQLLGHLLSKSPQNYGRYFEPFLGGGAFFFGLRPAKASLSDMNAELINTYRVVRDSVEELIVELERHRYDESYYYAIRDWDRSLDYSDRSPVARAGRFIYLNKTGFNGLHRVNSKGHFNVPFGTYKNPTILDAANLRRCSAALAGVEIDVAGYSSVEAKVEAGDFIYFDPPYAPLTATANFTSYTAHGFDRVEQENLRDLCIRLDRRGVRFIVSNSSAPLILNLYAQFRLELVDARRFVNSQALGRGPVKEVIATNF